MPRLACLRRGTSAAPVSHSFRLPPCRRQPRMEHASEHPGDVGVHRRGRTARRRSSPRRPRCSGPRRAGRAEARDRREDTGVLGHDTSCQTMEVRGPIVVPQPVPALPHCRRGSGRQRLDRGIAIEESLIVGLDAGDLGLLKHEFRDEDAIRIAGSPPGQIAAVPAEPAKQSSAEVDGLSRAYGKARGRLTRHGGSR